VVSLSLLVIFYPVQEVDKRYGSVLQASRMKVFNSPLLKLLKMVQEEKRDWGDVLSMPVLPERNQVRKGTGQCSIHACPP
jgi:hypothetical protein